MTKIYFLQKSIETEVQEAEQQVKVTQSPSSLPNGNVCKDPLQRNLRIHSFSLLDFFA